MHKALHLVLITFLLITSIATAQTALHTVAQGDTLFDLARTYTTTVSEIMRLNNLSSDTLSIGQQLHVPYTQADPVGGQRDPEAYARTGVSQHLVLSGDTIESVATTYQLSTNSIKQSNQELLNAPDNAQLNPGATLLIPPTEGTVVQLQTTQHILAVSLEHGVSVADLALANGFYAASEINDGQIIYVPEASILNQIVTELRAAQAQSKSFIWPIAGKLTSRYGYRNISVGGNTFHSGIDIAASTGTPIQASKGGIVTQAGWGGAYGYVVYLDHQDGTQTRYAHMSNIAVPQGATVNQADTIGWVGSTGASTGPHLHFEIRVSGKAIDPFSYLSLE